MVKKTCPIFIDGRKITSREVEFLELLIKGYDYKTIGMHMGIEAVTVKNICWNIGKKLNINNRLNVALRYLKYLEE